LDRAELLDTFGFHEGRRGRKRGREARGSDGDDLSDESDASDSNDPAYEPSARAAAELEGRARSTISEQLRAAKRLQAVARAKRAEHAAQTRRVPLATQPYDQSTWDHELPHAPHVMYSQLPPRPVELRGTALFGWVPPQMAEQLKVAQIACFACGSGEEAHNNHILLCDGEECDRAYHMHCLTPRLVRLPRARLWFCPACKDEAARARKAERERRHAASQPAPSEYERQRLANIAANQKVLEELGLAGPGSGLQ
jgi:hypothetical protein